MNESTLASVLIVDDTPDNITFLAEVLKKEGHRVRAVTSGAHALSAIRTEAPDLILLDVNMPGMDGYEVCRQLKGDPAVRGIPVLFLSALSDTLDKVKAFEVGGVDYVTKPFQVEEIATRVRTHLSIRRMQVELERKNAALHDLIASIARDERSPLSVVLVCSEILRDSGLSPEKHAQILADLQTARARHRRQASEQEASGEDARAPDPAGPIPQAAE